MARSRATTVSLHTREHPYSSVGIPRKTTIPRPRAFAPTLDKRCNRVGPTIGRLKQLCRVATRYDREPVNYLVGFAGPYLASLSFCP